jgi:hypothetical protein
LLSLEGDTEVFLHTQTWSYRAIGLYINAGFDFATDETFAHYKNDCHDAVPGAVGSDQTAWDVLGIIMGGSSCSQ